MSWVVICFQISIFAESYTPNIAYSNHLDSLWFAFKLVSLQSHIHHDWQVLHRPDVVICFQISIFAESYTPLLWKGTMTEELWFAFKLVSLQSHIHQTYKSYYWWIVVICFQISIFAESYTPKSFRENSCKGLWFAFKLVSLQSHIHLNNLLTLRAYVVICFQISIFAESYTPSCTCERVQVCCDLLSN